MDGVEPCDMRTPWWSLPVISWGAIRIILASVSSSTPNFCWRGNTGWHEKLRHCKLCISKVPIYSCVQLRQMLTIFKNSLTTLISKCVTKLSLNIPPHLKCVATLHCEIWSILLNNTGQRLGFFATPCILLGDKGSSP